MRIEAASTGLRKPVNVIDGNYKLAPGVCPWWDGVVAQRSGGVMRRRPSSQRRTTPAII